MWRTDYIQATLVYLLLLVRLVLPDQYHPWQTRLLILCLLIHLAPWVCRFLYSTPLSIHVVDNSIEFALAFQGGGGDNEAARLEKDGQALRVVLSNIDRVSQKILVLYCLSGTISDLESGSYTLQIEDSTGRLVAEGSFDVP